MRKGKILDDAFEQLVELGQSTVKQTGKAVVSTVSPTKIIETVFGTASNQSKPEKDLSEKLKNKKNNHTPLDFKNLQKKFQDKDRIKTEALRNRLFQIVRQGDEKIIMEERQKQLEKQRREQFEKEEKKRQEDEKRKKQSMPIPIGKLRRSIFSPKRKAQEQHPETKPATSKQ